MFGFAFHNETLAGTKWNCPGNRDQSQVGAGKKHRACREKAVQLKLWRTEACVPKWTEIRSELSGVGLRPCSWGNGLWRSCSCGAFLGRQNSCTVRTYLHAMPFQELSPQNTGTTRMELSFLADSHWQEQGGEQPLSIHEGHLDEAGWGPPPSAWMSMLQKNERTLGSQMYLLLILTLPLSDCTTSRKLISPS